MEFIIEAIITGLLSVVNVLIAHYLGKKAGDRKNSVERNPSPRSEDD